MKMKQFYIGSLKLVIYSDVKLHVWQWDEAFTSQIMDDRDGKELKISMVDSMPDVSGKKYQIQNMLVYIKDEEEWRVYGDCELISYRKSCGNVELYVKNEWWKKNGRSFRPWFYMHMEELLIENHALLLHSASIIYRESAILFTAPSGTGKTTQTDLWHRYLKDVKDLNGDRTVIQYTGDRWYGCGFPVFGSTVRCQQEAAPLKAIIVVRRGTENIISELSPAKKALLLYSEITVPSFRKVYTEMAMQLIEKLVLEIPILLYSCTMDEDAVTILHQYLYGGSKDGII